MSGRVPIRQEVLAHYVEESRETILHDEKGHQLLVLNEVAATLWQLINNERTVDEITRFICDNIDSAPESVSADIERFFSELEAHQLLSWQ